MNVQTNNKEPRRIIDGSLCDARTFRMHVPWTLWRSFLFMLIAFLVELSASAQDRPNIIIIVADDLGWNDLGYHGSEIRTPTLDSLAREGVELNRFYAHPTCSPTRSALVTGKSPLRLGFLSPLAKNNRLGLPLSESTIADHFRWNGYKTILIGKWHLGRFSNEYLPNSRGFDHFYGYLTGGVGHYDHVHGGGLDWQRNGATIREEGYTTDLLTNEAIRIIQRHDPMKPFFIELSYAAPHMPNEAPMEAVEEYGHLQDENRQLHAAMVSEIDRGVKRIFETLSEQELLDRTIVWFLSDNGGECAEAYLETTRQRFDQLTKIFGEPLPMEALEFVRNNMANSASDNEPLKGGKGTAFEGGVRVPSLIYAPQYLPAGRVDERITVNDVLPTLAAATRLTGLDSSAMDGVNQWGFLSGNAQHVSADFIVHGTNGQEAYYRDHFKLILGKGDELQLFDLMKDPFETNNVASHHPELVQELTQKLVDFPRGESVHDPIWKALLDMDRFGGEEDRPPWAEVEGVNAGPVHPLYFILPVLLLSVFASIWTVRRRRKRREP